MPYQVKMSKQTRFRVGQYGPSGMGTKPIARNSTTYKCVTAEELGVGGTSPICGGAFVYNFMRYNTPLVFSAIENVTANASLGVRHPSGHKEALALGYDKFLVLSGFYRLTCRHTTAASTSEQWIVAYKFSNTLSLAELVTAAGGTAVDLDTLAGGVNLWADMRQTRGWVYQRFSGNQSGGSIFPVTGVVEINIPDAPELAIALNSYGNSVEVLDWEEFKGSIADASTLPNNGAFVTIVVFYANGEPMAASDIHIDVELHQTVRLWRALGVGELIDEIDEV